MYRCCYSNFGFYGFNIDNSVQSFDFKGSCFIQHNSLLNKTFNYNSGFHLLVGFTIKIVGFYVSQLLILTSLFFGKKQYLPDQINGINCNNKIVLYSLNIALQSMIEPKNHIHRFRLLPDSILVFTRQNEFCVCPLRISVFIILHELFQKFLVASFQKNQLSQ